MRPYAKFSLEGQVLKITYESFEPTTLEFMQYLKEYEIYLQGFEGSVVLYDATRSKNLSAEHRSLQAKWINEHRQLIKDKVDRIVFVIPSLFVRTILKTILTFAPLPCPHRVCASMEEAQAELDLAAVG